MNSWDQDKINDRARDLAYKFGKTQGRSAAQYARVHDLDAPEADLADEWADSLGGSGLVERMTGLAINELCTPLGLDAADGDLVATIVECAQLEAYAEICDAYARGFEAAVETIFEPA